MKKVYLFAALAVAGGACSAPARSPAPAPVAGAAACVRDVDSAAAVVRHDYAGFADKARGKEGALAALTDSVRADARAAADAEACTAALRRWAGFFGDRHMSVLASAPAQRPAAPGPPAPPEGPSVRYPDDSTAVLRLPDFGQRHKPAIDSVVAAHRARILARPYLVVDVRGNGGGWTDSYASVLPLLYTGPIRVPGISVWASAGNTEYLRGMSTSPNLPEAIRTRMAALVPAMEANRGGFVPIDADREIRFDTVHPLPRAVAVLVDRRCASSCEQFALDVRQSRKVVLLGAENTRGMLDYGNLRTVALPSGERRIQFPVARSHRLPAEPLDATGVAPAVRVPPGADAVEFARRYLAGAR
ncbi:MAG TPA: S41 family peptidase [Longimicrobium sp.]